MSHETKTTTNFLTQDGANALCRMIRNYWHIHGGYIVCCEPFQLMYTNVACQRQPMHAWGVCSDLKNGLPPRGPGIHPSTKPVPPEPPVLTGEVWKRNRNDKRTKAGKELRTTDPDAVETPPEELPTTSGTALTEEDFEKKISEWLAENG